MRNFLAAIFFLCLLFHSCKKDEQGEINWGEEYFPLKTGSWISYEVDSVYYNDFTGDIDSSYFQIKEIIESEFSDNAGRPSYRVEQYRRLSEKEDWKISHVFSVTKTKERVERTENNLKVVVLVFPVREGKSWDGNAFNTLPSWDFKLLETHKPSIISKIPFDSTATVLQRDHYNLIETSNYKEVYAKHTGLVQKEIVDVKTEVDGTIKSGLKYSQKIIAFGEN